MHGDSHVQSAPNKGAQAGVRGSSGPGAGAVSSPADQEKARRGDARGPALLLAPPPAAAASGGPRTHWNIQETRTHNGGRGHHFGSSPRPCLPAPHRALFSERDENNGTERPPTRRRGQRRPGTRYRGPARRNEPREEQMAADGAQGQAYLSTASVYGGSNRDGGGKRPSLPVPGSPRPPAFPPPPAARAHARAAGSRPRAARAPRLAL